MTKTKPLDKWKDELHNARVEYRVFSMDAGLAYREMIAERMIRAIENDTGDQPLFPAYKKQREK